MLQAQSNLTLDILAVGTTFPGRDLTVRSVSETLEKLRADRDLQCYFFRPSAIAALSNAGPTGFTVPGHGGSSSIGR